MSVPKIFDITTYSQYQYFAVVFLMFVLEQWRWLEYDIQYNRNQGVYGEGPWKFVASKFVVTSQGAGIERL